MEIKRRVLCIPDCDSETIQTLVYTLADGTKFLSGTCVKCGRVHQDGIFRYVTDDETQYPNIEDIGFDVDKT